MSDTTPAEDNRAEPAQSTDTRTRLILDCTFSDEMCTALFGQPMVYGTAIGQIEAMLASWGAGVRMYVPGTHPDENPIAHGQAAPAV